MCLYLGDDPTQFLNDHGCIQIGRLHYLISHFWSLSFFIFMYLFFCIKNYHMGVDIYVSE